MKQENRHQAILYAVMRQGYVSIESLAEELGVSSGQRPFFSKGHKDKKTI